MKITINPKIDNRVKFKDVKPGETFTTPREGGVFLKVHISDRDADIVTNAIVLVPLSPALPDELAADAFTQSYFGPDKRVIIIPSELRLFIEPEKVTNIDSNDVNATEFRNRWTSITGDPLDAIGQPGESYEKDKSIKR